MAGAGAGFKGKLDWAAVRELRGAYERGETQGSLSKRFRVSVVTVGRIVRGESWQEEEVREGLVPPPGLLERLLEVQSRVETEGAGYVD